MLISVQGTGKNRLELDQENTWNAVEFVTLFFAQNVSIRTDRCAGAFREGETNRSFSILRGVSF
jgi:hypothetical protein